MNTAITEENYERKREELLELNSNLTAVVMREKELKLDSELSKLKKEFRESFDENVYSLSPLSDPQLRETKLYKFCSRLPKGADLHVHDMALLPAGELISLLKARPEFCINTDKKSYDLIKLKPSDNVPDGYMSLKEAIDNKILSEDEILQNWTVLGANPEKDNIWDYFETLFDRHAVLSSDVSFASVYYEYTFRYYCKINIMHVEIHIMLTEGIDESAEFLKAVRDAYYKVKKDYPYFTVRIIGAGVKADNENIEFTKKCFLNASFVQEILKDESDPDNPTDFVIGFDLVNEEDRSLPLKAFAPMLLKVKRQYPNMKLYIHGGESINAGNENLIDAYLLGVSRVGHGLNLYRYPDLHSRYVKSEICLEVCPISNQKLGYTKDVRNHPATEYLKTGMALALCSDDPTYMEYETLTDDFFVAVSAWDLTAADLKQLGINSIMYSGLDNDTKFKSLKEYNRLWNEFVDEITEQDK